MSSDDAVEIPPARALEYEAAALLEHPALARLPPVRAELDGPPLVPDEPRFDVDHLETGPAQVGLQVERRGPGSGLPGRREVRGIAHDEGGVPGAHQRLGGGRRGAAQG